MLSVEEYLAKRKKEDGLKESDREQRTENLQKCVHYVIDYFCEYLDSLPADKEMTLQAQKIEKYRENLSNYDPEVRAWCVQIYADYGKQMNRQIKGPLFSDPYFYLRHTHEEFSALSYDVYAALITKLPFLQGQTPMLLRCIQECHRINSIPYSWEFPPQVHELVDDWIMQTYNKYGVNLFRFADDWCNYFWDNVNLWPTSYRIKNSNMSRKYSYNYKKTTNLFNLDKLYRDMPKNAFTRGKKQHFEVLLMYSWLHSIESDEEYWSKYCDIITTAKPSSSHNGAI